MKRFQVVAGCIGGGAFGSLSIGLFIRSTYPDLLAAQVAFFAVALFFLGAGIAAMVVDEV